MLIRSILRGAAAGAAGTTALNAVTYLDMTWQARPESETPKATVERIADLADVEVPGSGDDKENRTSALGALSGIVTGVGVGALYGLVRGLGFRPPWWAATPLVTGVVLAGSNGPMVGLGVTDVKEWSGADWASDIVPHLAYGVVTALAAADAD